MGANTAPNDRRWDSPGRNARTRPRRTTRWWTAAVAVVVVAVAAACAPTPVLTPAEQVDQIATFVEHARGHTFTTRPVVQFLSDADFRADLLASVDAQHASLDEEAVAFTAARWIGPDQDLFSLYRITYGGGVVGYYDPTTKVLKVRGTSLTPYRREVIAHELTHALDDQTLGLEDITSSGLLDESYLAALVAIEGSASKVQQRYVAAMSPLDQVQDVAEQLQLSSDPALLTVPIALLTLTTAPYLRGATFESDLISRLGNPAGPDLSLTRYPATTEQAFDTNRYLADEPAVAVPVPPADGAVVRSGTWGQYLLSMLLTQGLTLDSVAPATVGWAGDAYVTWTSGTQRCLRLDTRMDDAARATTLQGALSAWAALGTGATVALTAPDTVRLTTCAG
jgi:hypothetical protein